MFQDVLSTLEVPSLSGVCPVSGGRPERFCIESRVYREAVGSFLVRGLCRLELPSIHFTCFVFFCGFIVLEEGFVINVCNASLHVYFFQ